MHPPRLVPVDALDRIDAGHHVGAGFDQPEYLLGRKADIGIHEQEMRRSGIIEEQRHQVGARARNQRVAVAHQNLEREIGFVMHGPLQLKDGAGIDAGDLSAKAGRGHHKVNSIGHQWLRSGGRGLQSSPNSK